MDKRESGLSSHCSMSKLLAGVGTLAGLVLSAGGFLGAVVYFALALKGSETTSSLGVVTVIASLATAGLGVGGLMVRHGLRAWRGEPDAHFCPPRVKVLALLFVGAVVGGQAVLSSGFALRFFFPPLHVLAGALPAVTVLAFVGRKLGRAARQREIVSLVVGGILIGGPGAVVLVGLAGLTLVVVLVVTVAMTPGGVDALQSLMFNLQNPAWLGDPDGLLSLLFTPVGLVGVFLLAVVISPLIEELLKPAGVLFMRHTPGQAQAFLWGLAGAAGFALVEGMFNSAVELDAWQPVVLMRVGTSLMHCLAGGLMGLGWYSLRTGRLWRAAGLYLLAVSLHGTWNAIALGITVFSFESPGPGGNAANVGIWLLLGTLGLLIVVCIVALAVLVRWLQTTLPGEMITVFTESDATELDRE